MDYGEKNLLATFFVSSFRTELRVCLLMYIHNNNALETACMNKMRKKKPGYII